jgi:Raf kinase inhibitor-like YbhB/YbcL family protein
MKASVCIIAILLSVCACTHGEGKETTVAQLTLTSPNFRNNQPIPAKNSLDGGDVSPLLKWEGAPPGTKSFALICDDPDAPGGTWIHWVIYGIAGNASGLPENIAKTETIAALGGVKQGVNSYGSIGYGGPQPPRGHGVHHYHFQLYALDAELNLAPRVTRQQLDAAMKGHIIAEADLVGTFVRE